jgi:O-antigen/teichoic acid export membrane protein
MSIVTKYIIKVEVITLFMRAFNAGSTFLLGVILARIMTKSDFGQYAYIQSAIITVATFAQLGLPNLLTREIAIYSKSNRYDLVLGLLKRSRYVVISGSLLGVVMSIIYLANSFSGNYSALYVGLPSIFFLSMASVHSAILKGFGYLLAGQVVEQLIRPALLVFLALFFVMSGLVVSAFDACAMLSLACFAGYVVNYFTVKVRLPNIDNTNKAVIGKDWLHRLMRLGSISIVAILNAQITVIIIGSLVGADEVAEFRVASQLAALTTIGLMSVNANKLPELTKSYHDGDFDRLRAVVIKSIKFSLSIAMAIFTIYLLAGGMVVKTFYGDKYSNAVLPLIILTVGQVVNSSTGVIDLVFIAANKEKILLVVSLVGLLAQVAACLYLAPKYGALGGATSICISLVLWNVLLIRGYWSIFARIPLTK